MIGDSLVSFFGLNVEQCAKSESIDSFILKSGKTDSFDIPSAEKMDLVYKEVGPDKLELRLFSNIREDVQFDLKEVSVFLNSIDEYYGDKDEGESFSLEFIIWKTLDSENFTIRDESSFIQYLASLDFKGAMYVFQKLLDSNIDHVTIDNSELSFETESIAFNRSKHSISFDRKDKLNKVNSICHRSIAGQYSLLPEDFTLSSEIRNKDLQSFFERIELMLTLSSIWDISIFDLDADTAEIKLNGYKSIQRAISISALTVKPIVEYRQIYQWIYAGGNLSDRIGLARNIISLHLTPDDKSAVIAGNVFQSIRSSFEVYLKDNISRYVEIRNKINDQLTGLTKDSSDIVSKFTADFQKSIFSFVSFFISVVILRFVSKSDFDNIMGFDLTVISFGFLGLAILYLLYSLFELNKRKKRFETNYALLKNRFSDLLLKDDINRILNKDEQFDSDLKFIRQSRKSYVWAWEILLVIFLLIILFTSELFSVKDRILELLNSDVSSPVSDLNNHCIDE
ncbi:MAG: hypothetical protein RLP11_14605 [Marinoscillum sp.]|uniref:hypothetical protein n=1 Tax=Marinoscillum sp. TaxID=2024838 RepID=UPI0032F2F14B